MKHASPKASICAFGFDRIGFENSGDVTLSDAIELTFVHFEAVVDFAAFDGVILPQGIFEEIRNVRMGYSGQAQKMSVERDSLLEKERQLLNLINDKGGWACFLVQQISDRLDYPADGIGDVSGTDLCKMVLNSFNVKRASIPGAPHVRSTQNEFDPYLKRFGVAKTTFRMDDDKESAHRVIAKANDDIVGMEFINQLFFLPFHSANRNAATLLAICTLLAKAIPDYRQKNAVQIPQWLDEFKFGIEERLTEELDTILTKQADLQNQLRFWKDSKAVLTTSGDHLKDRVASILSNYFGLKVDPIDIGREDGKILDHNDKPLTLFEVKGVKKGVSREYINQVDSHRERNSLPPEFPAALIINNQMDLAGIIKRGETSIAKEHIAHAVKLKILIIRTIDFLWLMKHLEPQTVADRGKELLKLLAGNGGWLHATSEKYLVETS